MNARPHATRREFLTRSIAGAGALALAGRSSSAEAEVCFGAPGPTNWRS